MKARPSMIRTPQTCSRKSPAALTSGSGLLKRTPRPPNSSSSRLHALLMHRFTMISASVVTKAWLALFLLAANGAAMDLPAQAGQPAEAAPPPPFKLLRYDESYSYLRDPARRNDCLDAIKFIPLTTNGDWYLTLGGEVR